MIGTTINNHYEVQSELGEGGMGMVYKGVDTRTNFPVAIKQLKSNLVDESIIERFKREGEALRELNHPNIVKMLDAIEEDGQHYLVMEYVDGGDLKSQMAGTLSIKRMLAIAIDLADALTRAHKLGIIHRDLKPANVLIGEDSTVRLTDFGVARVGSKKRMTDTDVLVGTIDYLPPEAFDNQQYDERGDIWAFGVILFELLAGKRPFEGESVLQVMHSITTSMTPDLEELNPSCPLALVDLVYRMLAKDPNDRIRSVRVVGAELEAIIRGEAISTSSISVPVKVEDNRFATPTPVADAIKHNLPAQTTEFVGRESELSELTRMIDDPKIRLMTILAPGGMGKSRLSLEIGQRLVDTGRQFPNGVWFVSLAPLSDAANIVNAIADATGYKFTEDGRTPHQQVMDYLSNKQLLLIMDNYEHLMDGVGIVSDVLKAAPNVSVIATSRTKLNLSGETILNLGGLEFPEWETPADAMNYGAVKLFMESAKRVRPDFELEADALSYIARICRLVQGVPLGILLAAAWLDMLPMDEIAQEIEQSLDFLETDMADLPERQRSIRAVFDYSWKLLNEAEQDLFMNLSVFRGGMSRQSAQKVTNANLRSLQSLVNKSLLRRDADSGRYEVHELLRQYAQEQLENAGGLDAAEAAHAAYYLNAIHERLDDLKGKNQLKALNDIQSDFENVRKAWLWAVANKDDGLIGNALESMYWFTMFRSLFVEGQNLFKQARDVWSDGSALAGKLLVRYAEKPVIKKFKQGLEIAEKHGDKTEIANCKRLIAHYTSHTEFNHEEGYQLFNESLALFRELDDKFHAAFVLDDMGWTDNLTFNGQQHIEHVEESLALRREIGDRIGTANSLRNLGGAWGGFGLNNMKPYEFWDEAKSIAYEMGDRLSIAWNAGLMAAHAFYRGEFEDMRELLNEGSPIANDIQALMVIKFLHLQESMYYAVAQNDYVKAEKMIDEIFSIDDEPDFSTLWALWTLAMVNCQSGNFDKVEQTLGSLGRNSMFSPAKFGPLFALWSCPIYLFLLNHQDEKERAVEIMARYLDHEGTGIWGIAKSLSSADIANGWAKKWDLLTNLQAQLKDELGEDTYNAAWERGKKIDLDDLANELYSSTQPDDAS